jgi:hypothetical protein
MSDAITTAIEQAIYTWVASSGLTVRWADQNDERPPAPFIEITIPSLRRQGHDWTTYKNNPTPTTGAEIIAKVEGMRQVAIELTCYAGGAVGSARAASILDAVVTKANLPSQLRAFKTAGMAAPVFDTDQTIGAVYKIARFEPRAIARGVLNISASQAETTTYIEFAEIVDQVRDPESSTWVPTDPP